MFLRAFRALFAIVSVSLERKVLRIQPFYRLARKAISYATTVARLAA